MTMTSLVFRRAAPVALAACLGLLLLSRASAQFSPPSTVFGSISDSGGNVEPGVTVEAYIGDTLCGTKGKTEFTGEGSARVTVYVVDVVSDSQTPGCGKQNAQQQIRIKVGDRFADQTATWDPGPVRLDVTFGGATPVAIPTFTPAPTRTQGPAVNPQTGETPTGGGQSGDGAVETIPAGSPGAGSPVATSPQGGITTSTPGAPDSGEDDDGGGVPVWAMALLVLGGLGVIAGGVGYFMSRNRDGDDEPPFSSGTP
jgi:MYXO-CTERM domain-containing protein